MKIKKLLIFLLFIGAVNSQTCGFGCLGLSGIYTGYSINSFNPEGLNKKIALHWGDNKRFGNTTGFRVGANIFRARFEKYFLTAKGFYQFSGEENEYLGGKLEENNITIKYETNYWGLGIDFGIPIFSFLDLKLIDGGITYYQHRLKETTKLLNETQLKEEYKNNNSNFGYYIGSGVILQLIKNYLYLEGTAVYNSISIQNLYNNEGIPYLPETIKDDILAGGGFSATLQINIGFPL